MFCRLVSVCLVVLFSLLPVTLIAQEKRLLNQEDVGYVNALRSAPRTQTSATLNAALTTLGSAQKTLFLTPGTWAITANVTGPITATLYIPSGASLSVSTGITFTWNGPIIVDGCNVFAGVGTIALGHVQTVDPCWFGAKGDGTTDDTAAITKATTAGADIKFRKGAFRVTSPITLTRAVTIRGAGLLDTFIQTEDLTGHTFVTSGTTGVGANSRFTFQDLTFSVTGTKTAGAAIYATSTTGPTAQYQLTIQHTWCAHYYTCFQLENSSYAHILDNHLEDVRGYGIIVNTSANPDAGDNLLQGNVLVGTGAVGIYVRTSGQRIIGNKILGFRIGIAADPISTTVPMIDLQIMHNSVELQADYNILMQTSLNGSLLGNSVISGNELAVVGYTGLGFPSPLGAAALAISGNVQHLVISNNALQTSTVNGKSIMLTGNGFGFEPNVFSITGNTITANSAAGGTGIQVPSALDYRGVVSGNYITLAAHPYVGVGARIDAGVVSFANLAEFGVFGSTGYCYDCQPTSGVNNTCVGVGGGSYAFKIGPTWKCFQ